ncbi:hypothetical protein JCM21900_001436 [Sporobolomyces salmonicolor]
MRRRSSVALPSFGGRRGSNSSSNSVREELIRDIFHVGLINLGNSCFYNTIVQSLSATQPLTDIIAEAPSSSPALQALSPSSPSYNPDLDALASPLPMTAALLVLLGKLDPTRETDDGSRGKKSFNPKSLLRQLSLKHDEYAEATQQDSHELLRHLIDGVMMEEQDLIKKMKSTMPKKRHPSMHGRNATIRANASQAQSENASPMETVKPEVAFSAIVDESAEADDEDRGNESDASSASSSSSSSSSTDEDGESEDEGAGERKGKMRPFVGSIFEGKLASFIICDECKNVSLTKEDFMDISLSLKDDTGNRMRKRDRIRRTLQAGFSRKRSGNDSSASEKGQSSAAADLSRRTRVSLSENEGSASASEADETDEEKIRSVNGVKPRSRHNSLDPTKLSRTSLKPSDAKSGSTSTSDRPSRDPSPLGRALSVLSQGSPGHHHHPHFHRHKPKIPKPTPEQIAYIRKVLVDVPGPSPAPLPAGLRVARPPGSVPPPSPSAALNDSLTSPASTTSSLSKLALSPDWQNTDLFECFRQFTSVEVLEGENSFACRNCWKCLNPELEVKRKEEKMQRKLQRRTSRALKKAERRRADGEAVNEANESEGEIGEADATARNSPVATTMALPSITTTEEAVDVDSNPAMATTNGQVSSGATFSRRAFSASTALSSQPSLISSDGGDISENALDTTEDEDDELELSTDQNGEGDQLPLTTENIEAAGLSAHPRTGGAPLSSNASVATHKSSGPPPSAPPSKPPPKAQRHILRRAHKRYLISPADLPPVLVVHLKRFMQTSKSSLFGAAFVNLKKRDDPVSFPKEMDLAPFLAPRERPPTNPWVEELGKGQHHGVGWRSLRPSSSGSGETRGERESLGENDRDNRDGTTIELEKETQDARYRLYAVVVHFGTIDTGHYAAYVLSNRYGKGDDAGKGERRWFYVSDEDVSHVTEQEVLKCNAYMLFYERVNRDSRVEPSAAACATVVPPPTVLETPEPAPGPVSAEPAKM